MTLVLQSTRPGAEPAWLAVCLGSVRGWADAKGYAYRLIGDELFEPLPAGFLDKTAGRLPMASDLGRLLWIRRLLEEGAGRVVWFDADTLIFDPAGLVLPEAADHAFGREIWVQRNLKGGLRVYRNIHNAVCLFCDGNAVLDFLIQASRGIVERAEGPLPPQAIGPKLLTALGNIVGFPLIEAAGAFSPLVLRDIGAGGGPALDLLRRKSPAVPAAANLCASMLGRVYDGVAVTPDLLEGAIRALLEERVGLGPA